jgi:choline monooxygenase
MTRPGLDYIYLTPKGEAVSNETMAMSDMVLAEDRWVVERVQENLDAGIYQAGRLSSRLEAGARSPARDASGHVH